MSQLITNIIITIQICNPYQIIEIPTAQNLADQACQNQFGTRLASIHSQSDQTEVVNLCGTGQSCWLGAEGGSINSCIWNWYDASSFDYNPTWAKSQGCQNAYLCIFNGEASLHDCGGTNEYFFPICNDHSLYVPMVQIQGPEFCLNETVDITNNVLIVFDLVMDSFTPSPGNGAFIHIWDIGVQYFYFRYDKFNTPPGSLLYFGIDSITHDNFYSPKQQFDASDVGINYHHELFITQSTLRWTIDNIEIFSTHNKTAYTPAANNSVCFPETTPKAGQGTVYNFTVYNNLDMISNRMDLNVRWFQIKLASNPTAGSIATITITLWWKHKIYQTSFIPSTVNATYIFYANETYLATDTNNLDSKMLIQNNQDDDAAIFTSITIVTISYIYFGAESFCGNPNNLGTFYASAHLMMDVNGAVCKDASSSQYSGICVDRMDDPGCNPSNLFVYFDTNAPNTLIDNAVITDAWPYQCVPSLDVNYINGWYDGSRINIADNIWGDKSGYNNHAIFINGSGIGLYLNNQPIIFGTTNTIVTFDADVPPDHTVFSLCKYGDIGAKGRILTALSYNGIYGGFHSGRSGVAYENEWITANGGSKFNNTNWLLSTQTHHLYRGNRIDLTVNDKAVAVPTTKLRTTWGSWSIAELIIVNQELNSNQIQCMEEYINYKYDLNITDPGIEPLSSDSVLKSFSLTLHPDINSVTTAQIKITLWWNGKIYATLFTPSTPNYTYSFNANETYITNDSDNKDWRMLIQNNDNSDGVIITSIKIITIANIYFGASSFCGDPNNLGINYNTYFLEDINGIVCDNSFVQYNAICIDYANDPQCNPENLMVYFDKTKPNKLINNALISDGTPYVCLPSFDTIHINGWYNGDTFNIFDKMWYDQSGYFEHSFIDKSSSGYGIFNDPNTTHELYLNNQTVIYGSTSTKITLQAIVPPNHTVFSLCKYRNVGSAKRIISGQGYNAIFGHHGDRSGVAYEDGWITANGSDQFGRNWVLSTQTHHLYRGNKIDLTVNSNLSPVGNVKLRFNYKIGEESDYACAEILIVNTELNINNIKCMEEYFNIKYNLNITWQPTSDPTLAPSIAPTLTPTYSPSITPTNFPSKIPTNSPSITPTLTPSNYPTLTPSNAPTFTPTNYPSLIPTSIPIEIPTISPIQVTTVQPTKHPILFKSTQSEDEFVAASGNYRIESDLLTVVVYTGIIVCGIMCLGIIYIKKKNKSIDTEMDLEKHTEMAETNTHKNNTENVIGLESNGTEIVERKYSDEMEQSDKVRSNDIQILNIDTIKSKNNEMDHEGNINNVQSEKEIDNAVETNDVLFFKTNLKWDKSDSEEESESDIEIHC